MGNTNNPGKPINWALKNIFTPGTPSDLVLTSVNKCTTVPIGKYRFEDVPPGNYILEISRLGFLPRYGKITVDKSEYLGHREIFGGDVNGDLVINERDLSTMPAKVGRYQTPPYNPNFDLIGSKGVSLGDVAVIRFNLGATTSIYQETDDWLKN
jgi:hypothetical protein